MIDPSQTGDRTAAALGHQPDQVHAGSIVRVGLALAGMILVSMIGMVIFFRGLEVSDEKALPSYATIPQDIQPPPPQLDPFQSQHLRELRTRQQRILSSYDWIDKEAGIARVPIDRAIEMLENKLPARNESD